MVAKFRNLTSSSSTAEYFQQDGGYYVAAGAMDRRRDGQAARAKQAEHRRGSVWRGQAVAVLGLAGKTVSAGVFQRLLKGRLPGTDIRLGRLRHGKLEHRPGFDITFSAPKSVSPMALIGGDERIVAADDRTVKTSLGWIEKERDPHPASR